ncbi:hypothetical protein CKAN_00634000 [Cinnamomum micranthum f. kanehirae]|uniref:Uncharacterized protein n=1 Tax=Cinnamomum micranthum f. kanehirae TaxID=337451 RepID=A0A3S3Q227_9MAGN|nr:hypothetical protein CKAN_00634000 [Cinnamomum micranthum f. kanehirae]
MKASLKFREDQKPLVRAKIPLSILGFPFLSGVSAGDSKELCLNLSTFFESGPSLKIGYRPNDSWNPFSLVVKTGIGSFGSPISAPLAMSAEFNLLGRGNPTFFLHFKPQIGDFSIKKTAGSTIALPAEPAGFGLGAKAVGKDPEVDVEGSVYGGETPIGNGDFRPGTAIFSGKKMNGFLTDFRSGGVIDGLLSGTDVRATTVLPLRSNAVLKLRWGVRSPPELGDDGSLLHPTAQISLRKIPLLVMSKISIEHVAKQGKVDDASRTPSGPSLFRNADVAEACYSVRRQLEDLQADNGLLRKAVEDLRSEIGTGKSTPVAARQNSGKPDKALRGGDRSGGKSQELGGLAGKVNEDKVEAAEL